MENKNAVKLNSVEEAMFFVLQCDMLGNDHSNTAYGFTAFHLSEPCWVM